MDYPAPKSQPKPIPRVNLPSVLTSFVGREREHHDITAALASAGGCGKTRLALRVAAQASDHYADAVIGVGLAQVTDPALAPRRWPTPWAQSWTRAPTDLPARRWPPICTTSRC